MKPAFYFDETFRENFWFFLGWKPKDVEFYCRTQFEFDSLNLNGNGRTIEFEDSKGRRAIVIWTRFGKRNLKLYPVLAHECVHAAHFCLGSRNVKADFNNDEPIAYLVENLFRQALTNKDKKR